jgi:hypothetical protein
VKVGFLAWALALPAGACGCSGAADIPTTPDMSAIVASYEKPTASLDSTAAESALANGPPLDVLSAGFLATDYLIGGVNDASSDAAPSKGSGIRLQGGLNVTVRCPGPDITNPVYDAATNGTATVTLAVDDTRIHQTFAGVAHSCVLGATVRGRTVSIVIDGAIAFDLGRDIGIGQRWSGELLASLPGTLDVDTYSFQSVSALFTPDRFDHLLKLSDGTTVVLELTATGTTVRDRDGTWDCPSGQACTRE